MPTVSINAVSIRTGGAETFLINILPLLTSLLPQWRFRLFVRQSRSNLYRLEAKNIDLECIADNSINSPVTRLLFEHIQVPRTLRTGKCALHWQIDEMLSPFVTQAELPTLAVFHTTPMVMFDGSTGDSPLFRLYARWIRKHTAHHATAPVTVSHHAKAELSGLFPQARDHFRVIYHGVDQKHYTPGDAGKALQCFGVQRPYLLSISNRFVWKNYFRLIQAYHKLLLAQPHLPYDLVIIGSSKLPAEEHRITNYIRENQLSDRVHLVDFIAQSELPNVYRSAHAYIFPSLRETFGMTILEAMACGLPVACARWGPFPEVAGDAALYFDPLDVQDIANGLTTIALDEKVRNNLAQRGLEHVRFFTWERSAQQYAQLIKEVSQA